MGRSMGSRRGAWIAVGLKRKGLRIKVESVGIETIHVSFVRSGAFFDTTSGADACINKVVKFYAIFLGEAREIV